MLVDILTPSKTIYSGDANLVQLPGIDGLFEVLHNHAPMIAALRKGTVKIENDDKPLHFEIQGGMMEIRKNHLLVLAE
jgi:F-type H+-transporting ATPase subunit epsilon